MILQCFRRSIHDIFVPFLRTIYGLFKAAKINTSYLKIIFRAGDYVASPIECQLVLKK